MDFPVWGTVPAWPLLGIAAADAPLARLAYAKLPELVKFAQLAVGVFGAVCTEFAPLAYDGVKQTRLAGITPSADHLPA
jgi:hypothetical protein